MRIKPNSTHLLILFIAVITAAYLLGLAGVPFHPDESTQIYMSADLELLFTRPSTLFWDPAQVDDLRQRYRELDAPLTRYLAGAGRIAAGLPALPADWDWTKSWQYNLDAGAYPSRALLLAARLPLALLFPITLALLFLTVRRALSTPAAWLAVALLASNALVLLHTRRAMAEPILLFTIVLTLYLLVRAGRWPWMAALPAALAFCAKQSAGVLIVPVLVAVFWQAALPFNRRLRQATVAIALFGAVIFALNPFLWSSPLQAFRSSLDQRAGLLERQVSAMGAVNPEKVLSSPALRLAAQIGQLYFIPPAIWDISNYVVEQHDAEQAYLTNPLHTLLRTPAGGAALMLLTLYGFLAATLRAYRDHAKRRGLALLLLANLLQMAALLWFVPLPIQRYSLPLVPFAAIWSAVGLWHVAQAINAARRARAKSVPA